MTPSADLHAVLQCVAAVERARKGAGRRWNRAEHCAVSLNGEITPIVQHVATIRQVDAEALQAEVNAYDDAQQHAACNLDAAERRSRGLTAL